MAMKALPMLCIIFLLFSVSLVFPSAEGIRTLKESKASGIDYTPVSPSTPANPYSNPHRSRGSPYTGRHCSKLYLCNPPSPAKP